MTIHMASYGKQNYRLDRQIKSKKAINYLYYVLDSGYVYCNCEVAK